MGRSVGKAPLSHTKPVGPFPYEQDQLQLPTPDIVDRFKSEVGPELTMQHSSFRILIIDHDTITSGLIQFLMRNSTTDCEITSVLTPDEGLRLSAAQRFDLYILDYRFAAMTGTDVCRTLRRTDVDTPIMFFTGEAREQERHEAMRAGADAYLVKPNDIGKLSDTVHRLLCRCQESALREVPLKSK